MNVYEFLFSMISFFAYTLRESGEYMVIQESAEDYLEAILHLGKAKENVRSIDIVKHLGISKPSVSVYVKQLKENGYINIDEKGYLTLTKKGNEIAEKTYEKHLILTKIFTSLGVSEDIAMRDACKIEHDLSDETFEALKKHFR